MLMIWVLMLILSTLLFLILGIISIYFLIQLNFRFNDQYDDEAVIYDEGRPSWVPQDAFVLDFHCHSSYSDGYLTPAQLVQWHISNGYDGMVISDHNTMEGFAEAKEYAESLSTPFLVIPGVEFTSLRVHLNLIGNQTLMPVPKLLWTTKKTIKRAIEHAKKEDAMVQFNHRDWYPHPWYLSKEWYYERGIDGYEVYNGFDFVDLEALDFIEAHKHERPLFASAGTDVHDPATHLRMYTEVLTEDRTTAGVIEALKEGRTRVYYDAASEKKRKAPEKGKAKSNPDREKLHEQWKYRLWLGEGLISGKHRPGIFIFLGLWYLFFLILGILL